MARSTNKSGNGESATCWYKCLTNRGDFSFCGDVNARGWQRAPAVRPQRRTFEHGPDFLRSASRWFTAARASPGLSAWRAPGTNPRPPVGGVAAPRNSFAARYGRVSVYSYYTSFPAINSTYVDNGTIRAPAWRNTRREPPANRNKCRSNRISRAHPVIPLYPIAWWISMKQFLSIYSVRLRILIRKKRLNARRS